MFKKYDDPDVYFSNDNKEIMNSDKHTKEDLLEYAKKHHKIDVSKTFHRISTIVISIILVLSLINVFINSYTLRIFILTSDLYLLSTSIILMFIDEHNFNIKMEKYKEISKKLMKENNKDEI